MTPLDYERTSEPAALPQSIWRNQDFLKLWSGATISMFGSQITTIALPLLATMTLGASAADMATLYGLQYLPNLLIGLLAGVWIDRLPRRRVLIAADLGRATLLLLLPVASVIGVLRIELVYVVSVLTGVFNVFAGAADNAYLPALVGREHLVEANAKLAASGSAARVAGPGIAGLLVDVLRASGAIVIDALSFLVSACALSLIRKREPAQEMPEGPASIWADIGEGLRIVYRNPVLRALLSATVTFDLFWNALFALYFLYVTRDLGLPATAIGLIFGVGSIGSLLGALLAHRVAQRLGVGRVIIGTQVVLGLTTTLIAFPQWFPAVALPLLILAEFVLSLMATISGVTRGSVIQAMIPNRLLGRVWASQSFIGLGIVPIGALLGGVLGEGIGVPATIVIGACGGLPSFLWLLFSPLRNAGDMPRSSDAE